MTQHSIKSVNEGGVVFFILTPKDEEGNELEFAQLIDPKWELRVNGGEIVEGCSFDDNPMTSLRIMVSGDMLTRPVGDKGQRVLCIQAKYNTESGELNVPLIEEYRFNINNMQSWRIDGLD